jgi:hypothetical protein
MEDSRFIARVSPVEFGVAWSEFVPLAATICRGAAAQAGFKLIVKLDGSRIRYLGILMLEQF